jgi:hypothetical protein
MKKSKNENEIPQKFAVVGGIDTLYYFADISGDNYNKIYDEKISNDEFYQGFEFLGRSGMATGFIGSWFVYKQESKFYANSKRLDVSLFRIGFKSPYKQTNIKNVYIQLYAEGIYFMGLENLLQFIEEKLGSFGLIANQYYVSRADINTFVNYDFSEINYKMFKLPARKPQEIYNLDTKAKVYSSKGNLETLYLGSKSSDINLKIYDKQKELFPNGIPSVAKSFVMIRYFKDNGIDFFKPIWNVEFSLKRKGLLSYEINTIEDLLQKAGNVFKDLMGKYVFLGYDVEKIQKYKKTKHLNRLSPHQSWDIIKNSYNRYNALPVKRYIKRYETDINANLLKKMAICSSDLQKNLNIDFNQVLDLLTTAYKPLTNQNI